MSELKNYRPMAIINVICTLYLLINRWVKRNVMLGEVQGGKVTTDWCKSKTVDKKLV